MRRGRGTDLLSPAYPTCSSRGLCNTVDTDVISQDTCPRQQSVVTCGISIDRYIRKQKRLQFIGSVESQIMKKKETQTRIIVNISTYYLPIERKGLIALMILCKYRWICFVWTVTCVHHHCSKQCLFVCVSIKQLTFQSGRIKQVPFNTNYEGKYSIVMALEKIGVL